MDAVKFVEERRRMFAVTGENSKYSLFNMSTCAEDVVKEVEEWSVAHPRKTRQSVFLEQYPETVIDAYGIIHICPLVISTTHRDSNGDCENSGQICVDCRREFWMQEVE